MKKKILAFVVVALLWSSCSLDRIQIERERLFFDAVAPWYSEYVANDPTLDDDQKALYQAGLWAEWFALKEVDAQPKWTPEEPK